ncbi:hypothetical protein QQP08_014103 [Theobroma cacao]|nr:hypothetical protein QQP08_014103 [Theobroma cacao]
MLPVCSATPGCSSHSQISFHGGLRPFTPFQKDFQSRCNAQDKSVLGMSNGNHLHRMSFKPQAMESFYSNFVESAEQPVSMDLINRYSCPDELDDVKCTFSNEGSPSIQAINESTPFEVGQLKYVETSSLSAAEEKLVDLTNQSAESTNDSVGMVGPETVTTVDMLPDNSTAASSSLNFDNDSLSSVKTGLDDFLSGFNESINSSVNKGENAVKSLLDNITSSINSVTTSASEAVDNVQASASNKVSNLSNDLTEALGKANAFLVDLLRRTIVVVEDSLSNGASSLVYIGIEGLERSLGFDPNDPIIPFFLLIGISATLWAFYWDLRERDGIPDLRRVARFRYASVSLPEVNGSMRKLLKSGKDLDDSLIAAVIRNLKTVEDRSKVIILDADCSRSKGIARSLRKLGVKSSTRFDMLETMKDEEANSNDAEKVCGLCEGGESGIEEFCCCDFLLTKRWFYCWGICRWDDLGCITQEKFRGTALDLQKGTLELRPYLVQGGFQSWVKQGLRIKELKPETTLTILNEEAEAILQDISPSPVQLLGYGVGSATAVYALIEWEKTLQFIGILGLVQTIYWRVSSYENSEDLKKDIRLLLAPVRVGAQALSWAAGKLETNRIGLPTSPSSLDVQNRVLQAAAKLESQPSDAEGIQDPSPEVIAPMNEKVDLSEA